MEGMPSLDGLLKMQEDIKKALSDVNKKHKEDVDTVLKLAITPQKHKNIDIDGTKCLVQLYEDKVTIVFPTKDLTLQYYDDVENDSKEIELLSHKLSELAELLEESQNDRVALRLTIKDLIDEKEINHKRFSDLWIRENQFIIYNNLPWYKRLKRWQSK